MFRLAKTYFNDKNNILKKPFRILSKNEGFDERLYSALTS